MGAPKNPARVAVHVRSVFSQLLKYATQRPLFFCSKKMAGTEDDEARAILPYGGVPRFSAPALLALRAMAALLSLLFTAQLARTIQIDGSPFRSALLTPWMVTTLIDFYLVLLPLLLLVLVRHRASPVAGALVCLFLCCLGTSATWAYLFFVFGSLRAGDPITRLLNC